MSFDLTALGWSPERKTQFEPYAAEGLSVARVAAQHRGAYVVFTAGGERPAALAGRLRHEAVSPADLPAVGDWVAVRDRPDAASAVVDAVLPRATAFVRKAAGEETVEQVVAANVDVLFLVSAFGPGLSPRRVERYLAAGWESGATPVVVLNKSDVAEDAAADVAAIEAVAFGVPVHVVSALGDAGLDELAAHAGPGRTVALLGTSGVGKSTIVNRLLGEDRQRVETIRDDGKGRHTTTHRELFPLPGGGALLDTPGMRELGLWDAGEGVGEVFDDIEALAADCRFADCAHGTEPACAVLAAVRDGRLDEARLEAYRKLGRELRYLERKADGRAAAEERRRWRAISRNMRKSRAEGLWG